MAKSFDLRVACSGLLLLSACQGVASDGSSDAADAPVARYGGAPNAQTEAVRRLADASRSPLRIVARDGVVGAASMSVHARGADAKERAEDFFEQHAAAFAFPRDAEALTLVRHRRVGTRDVLEFRQSVHGVEVADSFVRVILDHDIVLSVAGDYVLEEPALEEPRLSAGAAASAALAAMRLRSRPTDVELSYVRRQGRLRLVWRVSLEDDRSDRQEIRVDALTGQAYSQIPDVFHAASQPNQTLGTYVSKTAKGCYEHTGACVSGQEWCVGNPATQPAFGRFQENYEFRHDALDNHGWDGIDGPETAIIHTPGNGSPNARFSPSCNQISFDMDMDSDAIMGHEYGHAYVHHMSGLLYENEGGALHEHLAETNGVFMMRQYGFPSWDVYSGLPLSPRVFGEETPNHFSKYFIPDVYLLLPDPDTEFHTNMHILNKAARLLMSGGTHTGITVERIGEYRTWALWQETVLRAVGPNTDFAGFCDALLATAAQFADQEEFDFDEAHVCRVRQALASVGLTSGDLSCDQETGCTQDDGGACISDDDFDADGVPNIVDNCPFDADSTEKDADKDGQGDVCDDDDDNDGVPDLDDTCPNEPNAATQDLDSDGDGIVDACEDTDNDGIHDVVDNCVYKPNSDQFDLDDDGVGDACDDTDGDWIQDWNDNCPFHANNNQTDTDSDGIGDVCDNCSVGSNPNQADCNNDGIGDACLNDDDFDGVPDNADNCACVPNGGQQDVDQDGIGDACDTDMITELVVGAAMEGAVPMQGMPFEIPFTPCLRCPDWFSADAEQAWSVRSSVPFDAAIVDPQGNVVGRGRMRDDGRGTYTMTGAFRPTSAALQDVVEYDPNVGWSSTRGPQSYTLRLTATEQSVRFDRFEARVTVSEARQP